MNINNQKITRKMTSLNQSRYERFDVSRLNPVAVTLFDQGVRCAEPVAPNLKWSEECFRKALLVEPEYVLAQSSLGYVLLEEEKLLEAREVYEDLLERHPDCEVARLNYGHVLFRMGSSEAALDQFKLVSNGDFAGIAWRNIAAVHRNLNDLESAAEAEKNCFASILPGEGIVLRIAESPRPSHELWFRDLNAGARFRQFLLEIGLNPKSSVSYVNPKGRTLSAERMYRDDLLLYSIKIDNAAIARALLGLPTSILQKRGGAGFFEYWEGPSNERKKDIQKSFGS